MADGSGFDTSGWMRGLDALVGDARVSLARSMAVAGGQVLRDEAKMRAPRVSGALQRSIYLAFREGKSNDSRVTYSVTWNSKLAPHGHLVEFGHWLVAGGKLGKGGAKVQWVSAHPFLRPAFESARGRAQAAMVQRGRERLPELLGAVKS